MKKAAIFFLLLGSIFAFENSFIANAFALENESCWESEQIIYCDEEIYRLKNENGNRGILATHTSDKITLSTKIDLWLKLISFGDNMKNDKFILKLMTEEKGYLLLVFNSTKDEGKLIREISAGFHQEGVESIFETVKEVNDLFSETKNEILSKIIIQIEYSDNTYVIKFNSEQIELKADIDEDAKAELSFEVKSGDPSVHSPEIEIVSTTLSFKKPEGKEEDNSVEDGKKDSDSEEKGGKSGQTGNPSINNLKNGTNNNQSASIIITVSASIFVVGTTLFIIRQRKRNLKS